MRRRPKLALVPVISLAFAFAFAFAANGGCRKKTDPRGYHEPKPTAVPYKPPKPKPTSIWPTPVPGQPPRRPTMPG